MFVPDGLFLLLGFGTTKAILCRTATLDQLLDVIVNPLMDLSERENILGVFFDEFQLGQEATFEPQKEYVFFLHFALLFISEIKLPIIHYPLVKVFPGWSRLHILKHVLHLLKISLNDYVLTLLNCHTVV